MAGCARNQIVREGEIGIYHTWSRCVQRAYLCGDDPLTGVNYDYRRSWIQDLLKHQAGVFAVDIGNFAILNTSISFAVRAPTSPRCIHVSGCRSLTRQFPRAASWQFGAASRLSAGAAAASWLAGASPHPLGPICIACAPQSSP